MNDNIPTLTPEDVIIFENALMAAFGDTPIHAIPPAEVMRIFKRVASAGG